ncbi:MAG: ORF6N domain-containing protein [Sulfurimonas sp.]|uniref:ORF6N domain-containing protein n=1 Tax=Sulfurimonas sp. TaxID=2022749 RepID=UPI0026346D84|nr:ORF6N domain-containing protein [Sulfurimonas sp.]MDD2653469.1 ORF6N domain-containing protein [Sulfurimonas sp.]
MQELTITNTDIKSKIYTIRDKQVMLDRDLAELYGVETKVFNQAVKRNSKRFPADFMFQLTKEELENWRSQFVTSNSDKMGLRRAPYAFTEQGVSMLSAILKSDTAIEISVEIVRTFVAMRKLLNTNHFFSEQLKNIEKRQLAYEIKSDENFDKIFKALESSEQVQTQGIFFNGQIFDAHTFVSDLIRKATKSIMVIDNYIDDSTLTLLSKNQNVDITLYTHTITKALKQDIDKYNKQYKQLDVKTTKNFHDRFLIIDEQEVYHIGASLKDLGKKVFGFSKIQDYTHLLQLL